jgi:hypothetical protein
MRLRTVASSASEEYIEVGLASVKTEHLGGWWNWKGVGAEFWESLRPSDKLIHLLTFPLGSCLRIAMAVECRLMEGESMGITPFPPPAH